jgi:hypothetical protein
MVVWNLNIDIFYGILIIIYFTLYVRYALNYFRQKGFENGFSQSGPVELGLLLLVVGVIYWSIRESGKNKQLKKANYLLNVKSNYNKALETFISIKDWEKAAEVVVKSPPGTQIVHLRRLQSYLPYSKLKAIFMKLGEQYANSSNPELGASAYSLAEMPWRAAQTYILSRNVPAATDIINTSPVFANDRIKATRNLAKFAFDSDFPVESAQLLQSIGADEEAVAVLIAAGRNANLINNRDNQIRNPPSNIINNSSLHNDSVQSRKPNQIEFQSQNTNVSNQKVESGNKPITERTNISGTSSYQLIKQEMTKSQNLIKEGKIKEAEDSLNTFQRLIDKIPLSDSEENIKLKNEYSKTIQSIKRLNDARSAFKARKIEEAQIIYSELLESAGDLFSAEIFAEAGLTYEYDPADKELASEFFVEASRRAKTPQAAQKYKERADILLDSLTDLPNAPKESVLNSGLQIKINPTEKCCVCRRPVGSEGEVVQCNSCKSVAHYPHMAEWLKIKGVCPVCKQKLTLPEAKKVALTG